MMESSTPDGAPLLLAVCDVTVTWPSIQYGDRENVVFCIHLSGETCNFFHLLHISSSALNIIGFYSVWRSFSYAFLEEILEICLRNLSEMGGCFDFGILITETRSDHLLCGWALLTAVIYLRHIGKPFYFLPFNWNHCNFPRYIKPLHMKWHYGYPS